jgi:hypothetical protein
MFGVYELRMEKNGGALDEGQGPGPESVVASYMDEWVHSVYIYKFTVCSVR